MADGPREKYRVARDAVDEWYENGEMDEAVHERLTEFLDGSDGEALSISTPSDGTKTASTLRAYARNPVRVAE